MISWKDCLYEREKDVKDFPKYSMFQCGIAEIIKIIGIVFRESLCSIVEILLPFISYYVRKDEPSIVFLF